MFFHLVEPVPTPSPYTHTGIGGAGNIAPNSRHLPSALATASSRHRPQPAPYPSPTNNTVSSRPAPTSAPRKTMRTGIGGAGNTVPFSQSAIFSFDEELERLQRAQDSIAPVYHIGRGGSGNLINERKRVRGGGIGRGGALASLYAGSSSSGSESEGRRSVSSSGSSGGEESRAARRGSLDWWREKIVGRKGGSWYRRVEGEEGEKDALDE